MIIKLTAVIFFLMMTLFSTGVDRTKVEAAQKAQTVCPVQGDAIDKRLYVDYKGYRIYFCCKGCPEEFMKNPEKYMKKLRESGVTLEKSPSGK